MRCRAIPISVLWAAAVLPAFAGGAHYSITPAEVASAVSGSGLKVSADQVSLFADVVASVAQPALKVQSIEPEDDHQAIARMECADAAQCLPFMVALRVDRGAVPQSVQEGAPAGRISAPAVFLVRAGSPAILELDGTHVHITLPVVCLENGALGQTVRVATPDRRVFYIVQVAGDRMLRGRL